jgi:hypothetical protein
MSRDDRKLILTTSIVLVAAGVFFASVLVFATGTSSPQTQDEGPLYIGPRRDIVRTLNEGSPLYFANPFGGRGFWIDREEGELIAIDVGKWQDTDCSVKWRGRVDSYVDCTGDRLTKADLARHPVRVVASGARRGSVLVVLEVVEPPPGSVSTE